MLLPLYALHSCFLSLRRPNIYCIYLVLSANIFVNFKQRTNVKERETVEFKVAALPSDDRARATTSRRSQRPTAAWGGSVPCRPVLPHECSSSRTFTVKYERDREIDDPLAVPAGDGDRRLQRRRTRSRDR